MEINKITLTSGVIIYDNRHINCGIKIEHPDTKYIKLGYSSRFGFHLVMKGFWLYENDISEYNQELDKMQLSLIEANQFIKKNGTAI